MKKVEYVCDVCGGRLIDKYMLNWISMLLGRGVFEHGTWGRSRLDVCNNCWMQCSEWVRTHRWDKNEK